MGIDIQWRNSNISWSHFCHRRVSDALYIHHWAGLAIPPCEMERSLAFLALTFCMVLLFASGVNAAERIVGLVELPVFYGGNYEEVIKHPKGSVTLFEAPSGKASVAVVIGDFTQLEAREHDYEMLSAVFYELRHTSDSGVWFKVRYRVDSKYSFAWLRGADAGQIHLYSQLVHSHMRFSYFTESRDKRVFQLPNRSSPSTLYDKLGERQSVLVADVASSDPQDPWFLIVIVKGDLCAFSDMTIIATGWVPAYADNGSETVWYYSRGC